MLQPSASVKLSEIDESRDGPQIRVIFLYHELFHLLYHFGVVFITYGSKYYVYVFCVQ